jgi:hypothetical protein
MTLSIYRSSRLHERWPYLVLVCMKDVRQSIEHKPGPLRGKPRILATQGEVDLLLAHLNAYITRSGWSIGEHCATLPYILSSTDSYSWTEKLNLISNKTSIIALYIWKRLIYFFLLSFNRELYPNQSADYITLLPSPGYKVRNGGCLQHRDLYTRKFEHCRSETCSRAILYSGFDSLSRFLFWQQSVPDE